jgi:hypothetical protein
MTFRSIALVGPAFAALLISVPALPSWPKDGSAPLIGRLIPGPKQRDPSQSGNSNMSQPDTVQPSRPDLPAAKQGDNPSQK